jgi:hypothetical protein
LRLCGDLGLFLCLVNVDGLFNVKTVVNRLGADGYRTTTTAESTNEGGDPNYS